MEMSYVKFALCSFVIAVAYHAIWMFLADRINGEVPLAAGVHLFLLYFFPVILSAAASLWFELWKADNKKMLLIPILIILAIPFIALQFVALLACGLQGECF